MTTPLTKEEIDAILAPSLAMSRAWDDAAAKAGPNIMAHHEGGPIRNGGMAGAVEVFANLWCPNRAKFRAGFWLTEARKNRFMGKTASARYALGQAMRARRFAQGGAA